MEVLSQEVGRQWVPGGQRCLNEHPGQKFPRPGGAVASGIWKPVPT